MPPIPPNRALSPMSATASGPAAACAPAASGALRVLGVKVLTGRLVCEVQVPDERFRLTTPALAARAVAAFPGLPHHSCVNGEGRTFGAVMDRTSLPHMLEHLCIDLQVAGAADGAQSFTGTTEWTDRATGTARIQLSFCDDLVALRAFNEAVRFLNDAVVTCYP